MSFSIGYSASPSVHSRSSFVSHDDPSISNNNNSNNMDEAYRRLGHKLSQRVTSGKHYRAKIVLDIGSHPQSAFSTNVRNAASATHPNEVWNRTYKVAKIGYSDRGSHQRVSEESVLKKLTYHSKATFRSVEVSKQNMIATTTTNTTNATTTPNTTTPPKKKRASPTTISPPIPIPSQNNGTSDPNTTTSTTTTGEYFDRQDKRGLLEVVLDGPPSRKCLTLPRDPIANDGLDNAEGNLIVFEGDIIVATNVQILKKGTTGVGTLRVVDLLGQGTFAQVFLCECVDTGARVALKVVKNKQAYTRQAAIEIDVFRSLSDSKVNMVQLECYFVHENHLCLVFELLGLNLYEVLKRRQFRGLPLPIVRSLMRQAMEGVRDLCAKSIVHCDLKPENILLDGDAEPVIRAGDATKFSCDSSSSKDPVGTPCTEDTYQSTGCSTSSSQHIQDKVKEPKMKLIDFGSACFEGRTSHTYIQSRFYRSPEVLVGLPYDSAIDMWSLGCVAAELFLGLPILPGVHEHDQLGRISEMIGPLPDWMLDQGSKATKYFAKQFTRPQDLGNLSLAPICSPSPGFDNSDHHDTTHASATGAAATPSQPPAVASWRIKTQQEYIRSLSPNEIRKKGGLAKLEKQPTNRYFKRTKLSDIIMLHGKATSREEQDELALFVHFLLGILDPDPWKRWTAFQASQHPFIIGGRTNRVTPENVNKASGGNNKSQVFWVPPWDPSICRRKLLNVQKTREKQQALRRGFGTRHTNDTDRVIRRGSDPLVNGIDGIASTGLNDDMSIQSGVGVGRFSPPSSLGHPQGGGSALHNALTGCGGVANNLDAGRQYSGIPSSFVITSSGATSYGDVSVPYQSSRVTNGPQSYSGMSNDGMNVQQYEAEFGYALRRPGVVPSTHDLAGSYASLNHPSVSSVGCSPHHHHHQSHGVVLASAAQLHGGYNGRNATVPLMTSRRGTRNSYNMGHLGMAPTSQSYNLHHAPTSIQEDSSDYQLGGGDAVSVSSGASLLALQLEAQTAIAHDTMHSSETNALGNMNHVSLHQHGHPPYMSQVPMYAGVPAQGGYYPSYMTTNGAPMMAQHQQHHHYSTNTSGGGGGPGFHPGNFSDHQVQMHMMHQQHEFMVAPASLQHGLGNGGYSHEYMGRQHHHHHQQHQQQQQQPSFEEMDRSRPTGIQYSRSATYTRGSM